MSHIKTEGINPIGHSIQMLSKDVTGLRSNEFTSSKFLAVSQILEQLCLQKNLIKVLNIKIKC